jgi:myo-inositol 2-dehydrogenase/D-chiro-inositol 1-dehydrogenase
VFELEDEMEMMVRVVRQGASPAATAADGRWSVVLCLAAQASVDHRTSVSLAEYGCG